MQEFGSAVLGGSHNAPHDIQVKEMSGKSRIEVAEELGIKFEIVPNIGKQDGIDAARAFIPRCRFDRVRTERGRLALISYHRVWDEKRRCFTDQPYHDWSSHASDAFRYLAVGHKTSVPRRREYRPVQHVEISGAGHQWMGA
jgi:phage terminase large subunit